MARKCSFWVKLEPNWVGNHSYGWKAVGLTQTQPKTGYSIFLELDIELPQKLQIDVPSGLIHVATEADKMVEELDDS
jgi:hypothetical protein